MRKGRAVAGKEGQSVVTYRNSVACAARTILLSPLLVRMAHATEERTSGDVDESSMI